MAVVRTGLTGDGGHVEASCGDGAEVDVDVLNSKDDSAR
jgi:hypothetical protein